MLHGRQAQSYVWDTYVELSRVLRGKTCRKNVDADEVHLQSVAYAPKVAAVILMHLVSDEILNGFNN